MIDYDLARRPRRPSEWLALLEAIRDADPGDESDWLEWKSTVDWSNRDQVGGIVARAILGMANRPKAPSAMEGSGLIVIGLEAGVVHGAPPIDPADLEAKLRPFLGADGPEFEVHRVTVDGLSVLVIEVPSPPPGSPIYPIRKEIGKYLNGTIFARGPGRTDVASADLIDALTARARASVGGHIEINITPELERPIQRVALIDSKISAYLEWTREGLLAKANRATGKSGSSGFLPPLAQPVMESRSLAEYTKEVDDYIAKARAVIRDRLADFAAVSAAPLRLYVDNLSGRNYPGLHVTLFVAGGVIGVDKIEDEDGIADRLPDPPTAYGANLSQILSHVHIADRFYPVPASTRREITNGDPLIVRLAELELRTREQHVLIEDELVLLVPAEWDEPVAVRWEATAGNIDGIIEGTLELPVSEDVRDLLIEAVRHDGALAEDHDPGDDDGQVEVD